MAARFIALWLLLAAFLSGCDAAKTVVEPRVIYEREPPNIIAVISYATGSTDTLTVKLGKLYVGINGREIHAGDELLLIAERDPQPVVLGKRWVDEQTYAFEVPHERYFSAVKVANADGDNVVDMCRATLLTPQYLRAQGCEALVINASGSATPSVVPTSLELL